MAVRACDVLVTVTVWVGAVCVTAGEVALDDDTPPDCVLPEPPHPAAARSAAMTIAGVTATEKADFIEAKPAGMVTAR
jgi:hypothetical protein